MNSSIMYGTMCTGWHRWSLWWHLSGACYRITTIYECVWSAHKCESHAVRWFTGKWVLVKFLRNYSDNFLASLKWHKSIHRQNLHSIISPSEGTSPVGLIGKQNRQRLSSELIVERCWTIGHGIHICPLHLDFTLSGWWSNQLIANKKNNI